jgi:hypothetical protein
MTKQEAFPRADLTPSTRSSVTCSVSPRPRRAATKRVSAMEGADEFEIKAAA